MPVQGQFEDMWLNLRNKRTESDTCPMNADNIKTVYMHRTKLFSVNCPLSAHKSKIHKIKIEKIKICFYSKSGQNTLKSFVLPIYSTKHLSA